ncbi:MAG: RES family NAD+ phosphorylase [Acidimicrobiales bacterium]
MTDDDRALLDALASLPFGRWEGRAWRHMFNDYPPQRVNTSGARWNPPGVGAVYLALDPATALAEGQHVIDVQPRRTYARRVLYEVEMSATRVVDLTAPGAFDVVGLSAKDIAADDHSVCRRVGGAASRLGRGGLLVPSARAAGTNAVVLIDPENVDEAMVVLASSVVEAPAP